ncbi:MAG: hypothetical protein U1A77_00520 [Pirellulales bacterium]
MALLWMQRLIGVEYELPEQIFSMPPVDPHSVMFALERIAIQRL